jgi:hypothetical protein
MHDIHDHQNMITCIRKDRLHFALKRRGYAREHGHTVRVLAERFTVELIAIPLRGVEECPGDCKLVVRKDVKNCAPALHQEIVNSAFGLERHHDAGRFEGNLRNP